MTPHADEPLTGPVADFVDGLGAWRSVAAPEAGAELQAMFASTVAATPAPTPATATPRRSVMSVPKRLLATVPSKIAAGVVGALLAGSLGAGAMTGTITLTSNEEDVPTEVVEVEAGDESVEVEDADAEDADAEELEVEEAEDGDDGTDKEAGDPTTAPIPTTVSEAAHNHQFDEACGNHGAYVSHFAKTGEEPECAVAARAGGEAAATEATADTTEVADTAEVEDEPKAAKSANGDKGKAKAAAAKAKASAKKSDRAGR